MRITRPFVLLALAALLAPRAEASRTSVWGSNPPAALTAARIDATSALASLAQLDKGPVAAAETTEPPLFNLGDVILVESELEHEERFDLGPLELLSPAPLRGPPSSYPETRVGAFELHPPFRVGASPTLSLWSRQACGFVCREVVSDSRYDPWGLATVKKTATTAPQVPCPVPANPTGYPGVCDAFVPAGIVEAAGVPVSRDANEYGRDLRRSGAGADDVQALRNRYDTSGGNRARIAAAARGAATARPVADAVGKGIVLFGTVMSGTLAGETGAVATIGSGGERAGATLIESRGANILAPNQVVATAKTSRSVITGPMASSAEAEAYKGALRLGEYGLQRPGVVNEPGVDFITAQVNARTNAVKIFANDAKMSTIGEFPTPRTDIPISWGREVADAIKPGRLDLNNPALEQAIRDAFANGQVYPRQINVDMSTTGQGGMTGF